MQLNISLHTAITTGNLNIAPGGACLKWEQYLTTPWEQITETWDKICQEPNPHTWENMIDKWEDITDTWESLT